MATVIATGYYIHKEVQMDIRSTREEIKAQSLRTDRLYEMFIDLIKEGRK
ncbi:hypothetical protein LRR18_16545 [Mangrovimonas sp. AS39]|nr:hypothetical protein [Mangrovimonas futianensis]MCF1193200.1 hypothetical protein [Mangrovimonas futianensis]